MSGEEGEPPPSHETPAHRLRNFLSRAAIVFLFVGGVLVVFIQMFLVRTKQTGDRWWLLALVMLPIGGFAICVLAWAATLVLGFARFGLRTLLIISGLAGFFAYLATSVPKYEVVGWVGLVLLAGGVVFLVLGQVIMRDDKDPYWNRFKK